MTVTRRSFLTALASAVFAAAAATRDLTIGGASIHVQADPGSLSPALLGWIDRAGRAVTAYFGKFPVPQLRLNLRVIPDRSGVMHGTTFGEHGGLIRISVGQSTTDAELQNDWMLTHEMVHLGFPSMPERNHWIEEGSATYIEPIARVMIGNLSAARVWSDMLRDMPKGVPAPGDGGLDQTQSWASTYWGGALFCLLADVEIRKSTNCGKGKSTPCGKGLIDAFRAIVAAGGVISSDWSIDRAFSVGDRATGTHALSDLYDRMGRHHLDVDLPKLWNELGVARTPSGMVFNDSASLAPVRRAIVPR